MIRVLDDMHFKFLNRRQWRDVAAALQASVTLPNMVEALREGVRRLQTPEAAGGCPDEGELSPTGC